MTAPPAHRAPPERVPRGWMLLGHVLLAVAATFCLPLGVRDGRGVSSILPPLRTALVPAVAPATVEGDARRPDQGEDADHRTATPAPRAPSTSTAIDRPGPAGDEDLPSTRPPGSGHSRAPPPLA